LIILMLYSGMFLGILPNQPGISWESHLIGAIAGITVAYLFRNELEMDEATVTPEEDTYLEAEGDYFLDRDTFDRTRTEKMRNQSDWFSDSTF
jgi:hypothetical protein